MSSVRALVIAGPGTNRDHDVADRARTRRRRRSRSCSPSELVAEPAPARRRSVSPWSPAASATPTRSAPVACSHSTWRSGSATRSAASSTDGRPLLGICNGFQVLTARRAAPRRPRPQRQGRFDCRWVVLDAVPASVSVWTRRHRRSDPLPDRPRRGSLRAPRPRRARRGRPGRAALPRAPTRTVRSPTSPGSAIRPASCSGLMPHPENHVVARQHPRHSAWRRRRGAPRAAPVRQRRPLRQGAVRRCRPS